MENGGIPDRNLVTGTKSFDSIQFGAHRARLRSTSGFRADPSAVQQTSFHFIEVTLVKAKIITEIATQGLGDEWVTEFTMMASVNSKNGYVRFRDFNDSSIEKKFAGNSDGVNIKFNTIPFPIKASKILIFPTRWQKNIALRFELYGCDPGHYFRVWFAVLDKPFTLVYLNRDDYHTKLLEEQVLDEVNKYLKNVPGFLAVELHQFNPPFFEKETDKTGLTGLTADITIHCIQPATAAILAKLRNSVSNQGKERILGANILQVHYPVTKKCHPPAVSIHLSKDPSNAKLVIINMSRRPSKYTLEATLQPGCSPANDILYSWEFAYADRVSGMVNQIYEFGRPRESRKHAFMPFILKPRGLQYIRCLARLRDSMSSYRYDFGFINTVILTPMRCEITPSQGRALLQKFNLSCTNPTYDGVKPTGYQVTLDSSGGHVVIPGWDPLSGTAVRLPAGNPQNDYHVRLKVEAKFLSFPTVFDNVVVKVTNPDVQELLQSVSILENPMDGGKFEQNTYNIWILQSVVKELNLTEEQRTKVKGSMMRALAKDELRSFQQLKQMASCVDFSHTIKGEITQEIQEFSLKFIQKAFKFLNERRTDGVSNISGIIETLFKGAALVIDMAPEDTKYSSVSWNATHDVERAKNISKLAMEAVNNISQLIRNATDEDNIQIRAHGVSFSVAKVNAWAGEQYVYHVNNDEVRLPRDLFKEAFKDAIKDGRLQIIRFEKNPYWWKEGVIRGNYTVADTTLWSQNGTRLKVSNLTSPITIVFSKDPQTNVDMAEPDGALFMKRKEIRYHLLFIPSYEATITMRIKAKKNVTLRVYVRKGSRPTHGQYDLTFTLPKLTLPSFSNHTKRKASFKSCFYRDPYEFDLLPNATGHIGRHFIGIEIEEDSINITGISSMVKDTSGGKDVTGGIELESCVKEKPPPPPPPKNGTLLRKFDPQTDVNYTYYVTVSSCVFWDTVRENWSASGCQVACESNSTRIVCLVNHMTSFTGYLYVAPNEVDFDDVFREIKSLPPENMFVLSTVCLIFAIYAVGLVFARKADIRDKMKIVNSQFTPCEQDQLDGYSYEVSIQTGMWYDNGTTARVGMKLFGEERKSKTIFFMDPWKETKLFTRGSINTFTFNIPVHLGQLYKIQIWHDNKGKSPSWFLYQVAVRDLLSNEKWHFVANRWLAVERLDGEINVEVRAASKNELTRFSNLFQWRAITNFADKHLFLSLFTRPPQNPFTRCQRLTCMLSIIMVSLVTNAMFYRYEEISDPNSFQIGPLVLSLRQIVIGVQSGLISLPVSIVTIMIFRNTKRKIPVDDTTECERSNEEINRTSGFLPPCFILIGWFMCLTASITSGVFSILYSIQWGAQVSNRWLLSVGVSVLQDIIITGPVIIVVNTSIMAFINRKPTESDVIETVQQKKFVFHKSEGTGIYQPSEEELLRARIFRRQQRKMRHFFMELSIFLIFAVLLFTICYANSKPSRYHLTKSLKDTFGGINEVKGTESFWTWFEEELVPGLYEPRLYNGSWNITDGNETGLISSKIGFTVGLPRIRQIRIKPDSTCKVLELEPTLQTYFSKCLSDLSYSNKDTTPFYKPGWIPLRSFTDETSTYHFSKSCPEPWRYSESFSMSRHLVPYSEGGYVAKLGYDAETALKVKKSVEQDHWIDEMSVVILVEFVVFEPASLLLSNIMVVCERFSNGMRRNRIDVVPEYIFPSADSPLRGFYRLCILLWSIVILVLVILEVVKVFRKGCKYFKNFFNWISILQLLSSSCAMIVVFLKENGLKDFLYRIRNDPFGSWNAHDLVKWSSIEEIVLSITVVITTIKCLKLIQFNRHVHVMRETLQAAYHYLCSFTVIVLILAIAFAQLGTLLFGSKDEEYATLYHSLRTVLQMAIGIGKLRSKLGGGGSELQFFAPIFLMACMLSMTIIFTDTFIAILDEAYSESSGREYPEEQLGAHMKQYLMDGIKINVQRSLFRKTFQSTFRRRPFSRCSSLSSSVNPLIQEREIAKLVETESLLRLQGSSLEKRRKTSSRCSSHSGNTNTSLKGTDRAKLAETESLLSWKVSRVDVAFQTTQSSDVTCSDVAVVDNNASSAIYNENIENGFPDSPSGLPLTEEDRLLSEVRKAMENARSEFEKYLLKDAKEYTISSSSFSSHEDSFEEWGDSTSVQSLLEYCEPDSSINQGSSCGGPIQGRGNVILNVLRPHGHTYIEKP